MSLTLELWNQKRPLFDRLPKINGGYDNDVSDWLTGFWDQLFCDTRETIDQIAIRQLNPATCDPEWLDYLAPLLGWDSTYWIKKWSDSSKRLLLVRSLDFIWERKGNPAVIAYVFQSLKLKVIILEVGSFIIGTTTISNPIGTNPWVVQVLMPTSYQFDSILKEVEFILDRFLPCWLRRIYVWTDEPFRSVELLVVGNESEILEENTGKALDINN